MEAKAFFKQQEKQLKTSRVILGGPEVFEISSSLLTRSSRASVRHTGERIILSRSLFVKGAGLTRTVTHTRTRVTRRVLLERLITKASAASRIQ